MINGLKSKEIAVVLAAALLAAPTGALAQYDWSDLEDTIDAKTGHLFQPAGGALVIIHDGVVVYKEPFGNWTTTTMNTATPVYSVSKAVAAIVALAVSQDGSNSFDLADEIDDHVPTIDQHHSGYASVTVSHTISNTSGMESVNPLTEPCLGDYTDTLANCVASLSQTDLEASAGSEFIYTGGGWQIMGLAAENATGDTWYELADYYLFDPCDINVMDWDGTQNPWVAGGVKTNIDDAAEIVELLRTGQCKDSGGATVTVLNSSTLANMRADHVGSATITDSPYSDGRKYGYGLFRNDYTGSTNTNLYSHAGAGGSHPWFDTARGYSAFLFLNEDPQGFPTGFKRGDRLFGFILPDIEAQIDAN